MIFKLEIKRFADKEIIGSITGIEEAREILDGLNGNGKKNYGLIREPIYGLRVLRQCTPAVCLDFSVNIVICSDA